MTISVHPRLMVKTEVPLQKEEEAWPPASWPDQLKAICEEYSDVLTDEMRASHKIKCPPMDIKLKEKYTLLFAKRSRPVPLHW